MTALEWMAKRRLILAFFLVTLFCYMSVQFLLLIPFINRIKQLTRCRSWTTVSYLQWPAPKDNGSAAIGSPPSPFDPTKVAFMAETRPLPHLPALLVHMIGVIPPEWTFKIMGSSETIAFLRSVRVIQPLLNSGKMELLPLPDQYSLRDRERVSRMLTDPYLYSDILAPAEHLLVFQPDSIFCAGAPKIINDFLDYDWIGAPWSTTSNYGGNGGLSLRKVSRILKVLETQKRKEGDGQLEDLWLSSRLNQLEGAKMADASISKTFSVESVWDDNPLGYHIGWLGVHHEQIWDDEKQVQHILEYCPEVKIILGMRLDGDKPQSVTKLENGR
jgi:hypothetical protein